jgi:putative tricarboxylic transport membrane protein
MADARTKKPKTPEMPKADFVTALVLLAFSIAVIALSLDLPRLEHRDINPWTIPGLVPTLLGGVLGLMALVLLVRSLRYRGHLLGLTPARLREIAGMTQVKRVTVTIAFCLLYALVLIGWLPYVLSTFVFVFIFILLFEYDRHAGLGSQRRRIIVAGVEAVIVAAAIASLFQYVFLVRLP